MKIKIIILLVGIFSVCSFSQTNYYVSTTGNNSNDGSITSPWQTIQYGLNELVNGDTLNLETGTYNEKIQIPISGITLRNKPGHLPIIDAIGLTSQISIIEIFDVSDITIDGLELQNNIMNDAQGIVVENNCQNIIIQNCRIHDIHFSSDSNDAVNAETNAQGIIVYGTDGNNSVTNLKILMNVLYNCRLGYSEGIAINGNVDGFEVAGNIVYNLTNIGIDAIGHEGTSPITTNDQARNGLIKNNEVYNCISPYATSGGIYIDGGKSIIIENNTAYHNGYGVEVGCENVGKTTEGIIVRNNIFYNNEVAALALGGFAYPSGSGKVINSSFRGNTCYYNDYSEQGVGELYLSYTENCIIENNILYATNQNIALYQDGTPLDLSLNYNIYYSDANLSDLSFEYAGNFYSGLASFNTSTAQDANSDAINPDFVSPAINFPNFHIQTNSPAINTGNPDYVGTNEIDMDGESRDIDGVIDRGADEYASFIGVKDFDKNNILLYPNPTNGFAFLEGIPNFSYRVYSIHGQLIETANNQNSIDLSTYQTGLYLIQISDKKGTKISEIKMFKK